MTIWYALFMAALPALGTLVFFKLTNLFVSWQRVATVYLVLLLQVIIIQVCGPMLAGNN